MWAQHPSISSPRHGSSSSSGSSSSGSSLLDWQCSSLQSKNRWRNTVRCSSKGRRKQPRMLLHRLMAGPPCRQQCSPTRPEQVSTAMMQSTLTRRQMLGSLLPSSLPRRLLRLFLHLASRLVQQELQRWGCRTMPMPSESAMQVLHRLVLMSSWMRCDGRGSAGGMAIGQKSAGSGCTIDRHTKVALGLGFSVGSVRCSGHFLWAICAGVSLRRAFVKRQASDSNHGP